MLQAARLSTGSRNAPKVFITSDKEPQRKISASQLPNALTKYIEQGYFTPVNPENFKKLIKEIAEKHKAGKKIWHNNNSTIKQKAYIFDLKNLDEQPASIISELGALKHKYKDRTVVAVPVAGWGHKPISILDGKKERLEKEYAQSFSLAALTTAKNTAAEKASYVLRTSREAQKMEIIKEGEEQFLRVSAGVRITDADQYLFDRGFAFPPNMPTLHVASLVGAAANGCYGPARDYASMTSNIVEMKIINAKGEHMTLSAKEHPDLFEVLRDGHLGVCFVTELTLRIEPKFLMESHNMLFKDVNALKAKMGLTEAENKLSEEKKVGILKEKNLIDKEHFIAMYIPVDINAAGEHSPRIRITNFKRDTEDRPHLNVETQNQKDFCDYLSLQLTEVGEPIIDLVTKHPKLRKYWPFLLESAALKTYGREPETYQVGNSATIAHIFGTYTDLPINDINWLIQVDDTEDAKKLFLQLLELVENKLKLEGVNQKYPILNAFARYLKGICYPEGKGGIAATAVDKEGQSILSFELVTYSPLAATKEYKDLENEVTAFLDSAGRKYNFHPGKNMPDHIRTLTQIIKDTDTVGRQRIKNFKEAVYKLHAFTDSENPLQEGKENVPYSPFLTPQKKVFLGLDPSIVEEHEEHTVNVYEDKHIKSALNVILDLAKDDNEDKHDNIIKMASKHLAKLGG